MTDIREKTPRTQGGKTAMTSGFPHQNPMQNFTFPKVDSLPQHGQKPDKGCLKGQKPSREVKPRPGH
ncbi:MAG: hypothetical protein KA105_04395 [Caulobacter sp.]|jgi:hypothetical protein|nr:hypothetical protein [Caulobacter sp.]